MPDKAADGEAIFRHQLNALRVDNMNELLCLALYALAMLKGHDAALHSAI